MVPALGGGVCSGRSCGCCTEAVRGASGPSAHARDLPDWRSRRLAAQTNRYAPSLAGPWGVSAHQYGVGLFLLAGVVLAGSHVARRIRAVVHPHPAGSWAWMGPVACRARVTSTPAVGLRSCVLMTTAQLYAAGVELHGCSYGC